MGASPTQENYDYIWIDSNINNEENLEYSKELLKKYPNIALFTKVEDALNIFKKIKFHITFIIVSGSLFLEFIEKLKGIISEISAVPKIIIFTSESTKTKIENFQAINDSFYNNGGLVLNFKEVQSFLNNNITTKKLNFSRRLRREKKETDAEFSFQLLDTKNDIVGMIYLARLFVSPKEKLCKIFDEYLIDNYGDIMKELIFQIYNTNCPIPLRIKYWLRAYTLETEFYKIMNEDLMKDKIKPYIPYIQLLYSGLKLNNFNFSYTRDLFRGAVIKIEEIQNLIKYMENKKESDIPKALIYSKAFMSLSLDKNVAINFMREKKPTEKLARVLYILKTEVSDINERILINKNATNADLSDISFYEDEKEILLFPFSVYEISKVQKENDYYIIYLNILGKYKEKLDYEFKNKSDLTLAINQSNYVQFLQKNSLLPTIIDFTTIVVHFRLLNQSSLSSNKNGIHSETLSLVLKISDILSDIIIILKRKFLEIKDKVIFLLCNGIRLDKSKTLEQNGVKDDNCILICELDREIFKKSIDI